MPDKNPYTNTSEKIYRWSFYVIHVIIAFSFLIVYQADQSSMLDLINSVFKFTKDIYYLYVIPIGLKILGEYAPAILSALKGGGIPLATEEKLSSATPSPRETVPSGSPKTEPTDEVINEKSYH